MFDRNFIKYQFLYKKLKFDNNLLLYCLFTAWICYNSYIVSIYTQLFYKLIGCKGSLRMEKKNVVSIEDRIPKLKEARKKKANRKLLFYLSIFFLLISLIIYLQSPLSNIKEIQVLGNKVVSKKEIVKRSELTTETNVWGISKKSITRALETHPLIERVEVKRKLPQTVQLYVIEYKIVGFKMGKKGYFPILENGTIIKEQQMHPSGEAPIFHNFKENEYLIRTAEELAEIPDDIFNLISEISWEPSEKNKYKIVLYMSDGYIVHATIRDFANKMAMYPSIVAQLDPDEKGIIHMGVGTYFERTE